MKRTIFISLAILALAGLYGVATYQYVKHKSNAPKTVSLNQYNTLTSTLRLHDGVAAQNALSNKTTIDTLTAQKTQACAVLAAHKLVIPACQ